MKNINHPSDTLPNDESRQTGLPLCSGDVSFMKEIEGYYDYLIDVNGNIYSIRYKKYLKWEDRYGYWSVTLYNKKGSRKYLVHRLVAKTFIPNPLYKPYVNHIDGVRKNNNVKNLEWVTPKENSRHAWMNGLQVPSEKQKEAIREKIRIGIPGFGAYGKNRRPVKDIITGDTFESASEAARSMGISKQTLMLRMKSGKRRGVSYHVDFI